MLCILQSRMSSSRLPGKMLMNIGGRLLLDRVINRITLAKKVSKLVVATSTDPGDDMIADFCAKKGIACYRGSLEDVAGRFIQLINGEKAEAFIRINGDSPLIDPLLIDRAVAYFEMGECDLVTNVFMRSFPKGQSVEILLTETFRKAYAEMTNVDEFEHITKVYYTNPENFRILNFTSGGTYSELNMCVDTLEDMNRIERLISNLPVDTLGWKEIASGYQAL